MCTTLLECFCDSFDGVMVLCVREKKYDVSLTLHQSRNSDGRPRVLVSSVSAPVRRGDAIPKPQRRLSCHSRKRLSPQKSVPKKEADARH